MSLHKITYCPRCMSAFECKPGNIGQCQCYELILSVKAKEYIREQ
ncbi:cysteine-rich CWC family protein [Catalinimonas locisalis]